MAKQVQIRRDSATNLASSTPVVAEAGYDTTNKNLLVGDGTRVGGIPHLSYKHDQTQRFRFASGVGGTADAITVTLNEALDAYSQGVAIEFVAGSTNTGSTTVDVSSLGTKTIKKNLGGTLSNLSAGDIVSGMIYRLVYDGTYFQLSSGGVGSVVINRQVFTASGTWTKPSNLLYADIEVIGGGGGGGGADAASGSNPVAAGGGGGGGYSRKIVANASLGATETVTIGAGGTAGSGTTPANGGGGGTSSFGAHCSATGGGGGGLNNSTAAQSVAGGGGGGSGSGGDINSAGDSGGSGIVVSASFAVSGDGGGSHIGGGGTGRTSEGAGSAGLNYGGGGAGGRATGTGGQAGGAGKAGVVIVTEYRSA